MMSDAFVLQLAYYYNHANNHNNTYMVNKIMVIRLVYYALYSINSRLGCIKNESLITAGT